MASGAGDDTVKLWDVATGEPIATLERQAEWGYFGIIFAGWGYLGFGGMEWHGEDTVDMASREIITTLEGQATEVLSVSFSPDGTTLASASWDSTYSEAVGCGVQRNHHYSRRAYGLGLVGIIFAGWGYLGFRIMG